MMNNAVAFGHHVLLRFALCCGLLQVVKYWPAKGKSGFLVWRYLLRRDDDEPAPWTRDGKERIKKLGLTIQVAMSFQNTLYWRAFIVCKKSVYLGCIQTWCCDFICSHFEYTPNKIYLTEVMYQTYYKNLLDKHNVVLQ